MRHPVGDIVHGCFSRFGRIQGAAGRTLAMAVFAVVQTEIEALRSTLLDPIGDNGLGNFRIGITSMHPSLLSVDDSSPRFPVTDKTRMGNIGEPVGMILQESALPVLEPMTAGLPIPRSKSHACIPLLHRIAFRVKILLRYPVRFRHDGAFCPPPSAIHGKISTLPCEVYNTILRRS